MLFAPLALTLVQPYLHIGEHYTDALAGLALYSDAISSVVMQIGWFDQDGKNQEGYKALMNCEPRFGAAAPDDSYHRLDWKVNGDDVRYEWGRTGAAQAVVRISTSGPVRLTLGFGPAWPGSKPEISWSSGLPNDFQIKSGNLHLNVSANGALFNPVDAKYLLPKPKPLPPGVFMRRAGTATLFRYQETASFNVAPGHPILLSISEADKTPLSVINKTLDTAAAHYQNQRTRATGDWGDFVAPIANQLGHSRVYSCETGRLAHTVSRNWCLPDGQVLFCWDSFFNGLLSSVENPAAGRDTVRAILAAQQPNGLIPNFFGRGWGVSADRSQPPVGSMCVWKMYQRDPDKPFLAEVYPKLLRWHHFWFAKGPNGKPNRDGNEDGLLEWGSATGDLQNAKFESGLDDSPMFDTGTMSGPNMMLDSTDLSSLYAMDADYLSRIAELLGKKEEAEVLRKDHDRMADRLNKLLWNEDLGTYSYRYWSPVQPSKALALSDLVSTTSGKGLKAEYFEGRNFDKKVIERQDTNIDFDWGYKPPVQGLEATDYSVRWTGTFTPQSTDPYIFTTAADDGARVWLDGKLIVDDWQIHGVKHTPSAAISLTAGTGHDLRVDYFQAAGGASMKLDVAEVDEAAPPTSLLPRLSPLNFYPMLAGVPTISQAHKMLDLFYRPDKFNGDEICPTISRDDPAFPAQGYWRGTVWGPTSYLVYQGVRRYATDAQRIEYAKKSVALFMKNWTTEGTCRENFNVVGASSSDPHYTWGALMCLMGIEELCDIEPDGMLRLNGASGVHVHIQNFRLGGKVYDLKIEPNRAVLSLAGHVVAGAKGKAQKFAWQLLD